MAIATIQQAIDRGEVSVYLSANDNSKGLMWGHRVASPISMITIAMVTDALAWGNEGGAQSATDLRQMANYLVWLTGMYGQQAEAILDGSGGGSVVPGGGSSQFRYPLRVTGADFEADGITFNYAPIVGDNLMLFVSNYSQEWQFAPAFFSYTSTGFVITVPGFNANDYNQIIIDEYFPIT